jgi:uncharacterized protein YerC
MKANGYSPKVAVRLTRYAEAVRLVDEGNARPQVVEAVDCIRKGLTWQQAIRKLGISRSAYYQRLNDSTDAKNKARKARNGGECVECGAPTDGSNGRAKAPVRCCACEQTKNLEENEQVIELWEQGWTASEIGPEFGLTVTQVTSRIDAIRRVQGFPITMHRLRNREAWPVVEKCWNAGIPATEIAMEVGSTQASIWKMVKTMREAGHDLIVRHQQRDEEYRAEFVKLWNEGRTCAEIADHFGITRSGASSFACLLRKRGYDVPSRSKVAA